MGRAELKLRNESYRVLIVPPVEVIPYATLAKAKEFFDQGGVVVAHGFLPTKSATLGKTSADIAQLREAIWGDADARPGRLQDQSAAADAPTCCRRSRRPSNSSRCWRAMPAFIPTLEVLEGETDHWLHVLHRVKAGRDVFFIANQNHQGEPRTFRFRITADGRARVLGRHAQRDHRRAVSRARASRSS